MSKPFNLPVAFQDESARIERGLELVGRLCAAVDDDEEVDAWLVREISAAIKNFLRQKSALESVYGRVENYDDEDFAAMVEEFRRRLRV